MTPKKSEIYWKQKNGSLIDVDDMTESHLRNVLKMLIRNKMIGKQKPERDDKWSHLYSDYLEALDQEQC
jgi:hypothetical protein